LDSSFLFEQFESNSCIRSKLDFSFPVANQMSSILDRAKEILSKKKAQSKIKVLQKPIVDEASIDSDELELRDYLQALSKNRPIPFKSHVGELESDGSDESSKQYSKPIYSTATEVKVSNPYLKKPNPTTQVPTVGKYNNANVSERETLVKSFVKPIKENRELENYNAYSTSSSKNSIIGIEGGKKGKPKAVQSTIAITNPIVIVPKVDGSNQQKLLTNTDMKLKARNVHESDTDSSIASNFSRFLGDKKYADAKGPFGSEKILKKNSTEAPALDAFSNGIVMHNPIFGKIKNVDDIDSDLEEEIVEEMDATSDYYSMSESIAKKSKSTSSLASIKETNPPVVQKIPEVQPTLDQAHEANTNTESVHPPRKSETKTTPNENHKIDVGMENPNNSSRPIQPQFQNPMPQQCMPIWPQGGYIPYPYIMYPIPLPSAQPPAQPAYSQHKNMEQAPKRNQYTSTEALHSVDTSYQQSNGPTTSNPVLEQHSPHPEPLQSTIN
jgi:hypothetical protein